MHAARRSTRFASKGADSNNQLGRPAPSLQIQQATATVALKELPGLAGFGGIFLNLAPRFARLVIDA
jgi:hypothetical protein